MEGAMQNAIEQHLVQAAATVEAQLDSEMERLEKMDEDDLESLRQKRIRDMKKLHDKKREWAQQGHGKYDEIPEEKEFFEVSKKSKNVVCHFYRDSAFRCKIVDKHLALLAPKHMECRFVRINAEKCPFLTQRLKIRVIPTLMITKDAKTVDFIIGFDDLGGHDEFSTEMLEWRIARADVITYNGDLLTPPDDAGAKKSNTTVLRNPTKKNLRDRDDDSSDDDW